MVTREELRRKYKLKILLRGATGSGKTYTAVRVAGYVASKGWKVLYLDHERGSSEELEKLEDKLLENIIHEDFRNYKQIMDFIKKYTTEYKDKLKLIVIDPMYLIEMTRLSARDAFLDQGYYWIGEKKVDIDNKETFDLRGFMYQVATTYQNKLLGEIVSCGQDIICTLMTPNKHETDYDGSFSIVLETFNAWAGNKIFYKAMPKKFRGVDLNTMPAIDDPYKKILEGFTRKYESYKDKPEIKLENEFVSENKEENNDQKVDVEIS
jgi:hypothetical protein